MRSDSASVHTGAMLVQGFGTQPYKRFAQWFIFPNPLP